MASLDLGLGEDITSEEVSLEGLAEELERFGADEIWTRLDAYAQQVPRREHA